jgi:DNA replication protein DnaC
MITTPLDQPPDEVVECRLCGQPLKVRYHWIEVIDTWLRPSCHDACCERYEANQRSGAKPLDNGDREVPEHFRGFDPNKADQDALESCSLFTPDSRLRTLALIGVPRRGKSRLMWAIIEQFFTLLERNRGVRRWVDYFLFTDLISEMDRNQLAKLKMSKHAFLDDVGSVESFGKERAGLQQVLRARIQKGDNWTFLTVDSLSFDPGLVDLMHGRATIVYIDK